MSAGWIFLIVMASVMVPTIYLGERYARRHPAPPDAVADPDDGWSLH